MHSISCLCIVRGIPACGKCDSHELTSASAATVARSLLCKCHVIQVFLLTFNSFSSLISCHKMSFWYFFMRVFGKWFIIVLLPHTKKDITYLWYTKCKWRSSEWMTLRMILCNGGPHRSIFYGVLLPNYGLLWTAFSCQKASRWFEIVILCSF